VRVGAILALVATIGFAAIDFPKVWNHAAGFVSVKTGVPIFTIAETPFRLGLDLQGGAHLVYEADMSAIPEEDRVEALNGVKDVIERRVNTFGVAEPVVQTTTTGGTYRVIVELAGVMDVSQAIDQIGETPVLEFKEPEPEAGRELTTEEQAQLEEMQVEDRAAAQVVLSRARAGEDFASLIEQNSIAQGSGALSGITEDHYVYGTLVKAIQNTWTSPGNVVSQVVETPEGLVIAKYIQKSEITESHLSHILICYEGATGCTTGLPEIEANIKIGQLKDEATPENFAELAKQNSTDGSAAGGGDLGWASPGQMVAPFELEALQTPVGAISNPVKTEFGYHLIYKQEERQTSAYDLERIVMKLTNQYDIVPYSPWKNTALSGKHLKRAGVEFHVNTGAPIVALQFNEEGADLFADLTQAHVGEPIGIFLDGELISSPVVQAAIFGGEAIITGDFTVEEARILAQRLNAGALPVPVSLLSQQTVGPTLGEVSLEKSVVAAGMGFAFVAAFMIAYYRLPGLIAALALVLYLFLNLACYRLFGVTITLAGITGFVLSLGMAVDANVLIIERLKEELKAGRDHHSATDEAYRRAWPAIRDGNVTTLIATAILYWFSSSFIQGFALTLSIGVILSMFTAIIISRFYHKNVIQWPRLTKRAWLFGHRHQS
jgi:protein-export membrane protein SecD